MTDQPDHPPFMAPLPPTLTSPPRPFDRVPTEPVRPFAADGSLGPPAAPGRMGRFGALALVVAVVFGAGIVVGRASVPTTGTVGPGSASPVGGSPAPSSLAGLPSEGARLGEPDARVMLTYWADYQCPFCARFAATILPQLASRIADGTLAVEHRDFAFLGQESIDAAVAVRCAGREGRYWAMHDAVYAAQQGENQGAFVKARLEALAAAVGVDPAAFAACLDERSVLVDVLADTADGIRSGVASTPTIDVNGNRFLGVSDAAALLQAIDQAAAGGSPAVIPTPEPSQDPWSGIATSGRDAGSASAPMTVQLWLDYQSPDTAAIARDLEPKLRTRIASGAIRAELDDLATLGDESVLAGVSVRCVAAVDPRAWFMSDVLAVSAQGVGTGLFTPSTILRFVSRVGMDVRGIDTCLDDPSVAAAVKAESATGVAAGLTAPSVVVLRAGKEIARFAGPIDIAAVLKAIDGPSSGN